MVQPRENLDSVRHPRAATGLRRAADDLPSWIAGQDLTEADLPYIHLLLETSFDDWIEQSEGFPWLSGWPIVLLHPDYTEVAVSGAAANEGLPVSWRRESTGPTAAGMALESCRPALMRAEEHEHPALRSRDTLAVPIFSRSTGFVFAAIVCSAPAGAAGAGGAQAAAGCGPSFQELPVPALRASVRRRPAACGNPSEPRGPAQGPAVGDHAANERPHRRGKRTGRSVQQP
ncbi:hypothetical protein OMP38_22870 [Cohnella ginsengisoli]|uniref:GAF domain-containing protein n=1 Tax=Cohnella ginsengisoli TaxID=425004 RepID=A0A9X4KPB6_9BACL|nr:hypothetical protein [Cohnella ginsengisoli]MDG0793365.1 hypothetical protein [Cohnella ginsengisoli]